MEPAADLVAQLGALNDIVVPLPVAWWPPAPGWYALAALAAVLAAWGAVRRVRRWRCDAYRRSALRDLALIRARLADPARRAPALADLAELVRRSALQGAPRERVAALSGEAWLAFLDAGVGGDAFRAGAGRLLAVAPYRPPAAIAQLDAAELQTLCALVARWLRSHRRLRAAPAHPA